MTVRRFEESDVVWNNQPVHLTASSLADVIAALPTFRKTRFVYKNALNENLDVILREPHGADDRVVPVATVSRRYALIQHRDLIRWITAAFEQQGWNPAAVQAKSTVSQYGERMFVRISIPGVMEEIRVGDRIAAEVRIWNSVDRTRALEVAIGWRRLVCSNGLAIWEGDRLRKVHHADWMSRASPVEFLRRRLPKSRKLADLLRQWAGFEITRQEIVAWADGPVTKAWGKSRAARILHITRTGRDCAVGHFKPATKPSEVETHPEDAVPGAVPNANTAYDLYQALLWMAGQERSVEDHEAKTKEALDLILPLLPPSLRPTSA